MLGWHGVCGFFGLWYEAYVLVYQFTGRLLGLFNRYRFGQIAWFVYVCATR